ncbi:hypothetical protein LX16_2479 [Stackebrandtia albiflava]|uniref:Uncharacterized protein n=1 Tax=Stackebrandtia albiflava TaxID=406432 RepID=A0A562V1S6_9ACTN|nr:hypothetical protein [Stackebrandtia albiflava]TWJ11747.1 hypothetical protein LX16_2479 [Stackebrandtia albiflava]
MRTRLIHAVGAVIAASVIGAGAAGTAFAAEPLPVAPGGPAPSGLDTPWLPLLGDTMRPLSAGDFPAIATTPGEPSGRIESSASPAPGRHRVAPVSSGIRADLIGSRPLGGSTIGGARGDIAPHRGDYRGDRDA